MASILEKRIESVEKVQKRATKLVSELKDLTYIERLKTFKLPSLAHRRRRDDMIQTFKIIKGIEDIPSERFFKVSKESSTRGHSLKLEKPRCKTTVRQQHFSQRVILFINDWNSLPERVVRGKDVNQFKTRIDHYWGQEVIYDY